MRQDLNPQSFDRESSLLSTGPGFRLLKALFEIKTWLEDSTSKSIPHTISKNK